jgi:hypothetical protein
MKARLLLPLLALCALWLSAPGSLVAAEFRSLFNGRDLSNWEGNPLLWSVKNGVIRGETTLRAIALSNTFLIWKGGVLKDFELRIKFRIQNGNSGIQYRSKKVGKWSVAGYQAEIENTPGKVGFLYEERGRKYLANVGERVEMQADGTRRVLGQIAPKEEYLKAARYKQKDWNEYRIVAQGNHLTHYLNGMQTVELTDNDPAHRSLAGILALQIHAGLPMTVEFKDIFLRDL